MTKPLHDRDFFAWTQAQADALRRRSANELDWDELGQEIESMGGQLRSQLHSHLVILLLHLIKWRIQPTRRSRSWRLSIEEQRREVERLIRLNPSLQPFTADIFADAYPVARLRALRETRLAEAAAPETPFLDFETAMNAPVDET
jgi:hypothetical protein